MIVLTGQPTDETYSLVELCRSVSGIETRFCQTGDELTAILPSAQVVIHIDAGVTRETRAVAALVSSFDVPQAILVDSVFSGELAELMGDGLRWIATYEGEDSLIFALGKLGVVTGCTHFDCLALDGAAGFAPLDSEPFRDLITEDPRMLAVLAKAEMAARTSQTVLIGGQTGTGKDLVAEAIHRASGVSGRFVAENVSGLDDTLFSDALFGHVRGSYTGAVNPREGLVRRAEGGTLFLDEIGDLSLSSQTKLLRLLENREYYPIGSDRPATTSARFVVTTHRNLAKRVRDGDFRRDLYFRLRVHELYLPPLYERAVDLEPLARFFAARASSEIGRAQPNLSAGFLECLFSYSFPGNVRELRSIMYRAVALCPGDLLRSVDFSPAFLPVTGPRRISEVSTPPQGVRFPSELPTMDDVARSLVEEALSRAGGNQSAAARMIGLTPSAISKRLRGYQPK